MFALPDKIGFAENFDNIEEGDDDSGEWANVELKMEYGDKNKLDELYEGV